MKKRGKEKAQASTFKSDEEIIAERKRLDAFDTADTFLFWLSWGQWVLAIIWFLSLSDVEDAAADSPERHGPSDATFSLLVSGLFCRGISWANPRCWSWWRRGFHLGCALLLGLMGFALVLGTSQKHWQDHVDAKAVARYAGIGCLALLAAAVWTFPRSRPDPAKVASAPVGRLLFLFDGLAGCSASVAIFAGFDMGAGFYTLTASVIGGPLLLYSVGMLFVCSEAELLVAAPVAMAMHLGAFFRCWYLFGFLLATPCVFALVAHAALYLPLPWQDPDSNVFHSMLRRRWRKFIRFMQSPISGFGDDGEGAD